MIRRATVADVQGIADCVNRAYRHYIQRMGRPPAPMLEDYSEAVEMSEVFAAETGRRIVGVLVLRQTGEGFLLDNVAVDPEHQGQGIGRELLMLAEARATNSGYDSIYLYTNEAMIENLQLYAKIGYNEYARRIEHGFSRIYMRKHLSAAAV